MTDRETTNRIDVLTQLYEVLVSSPHGKEAAAKILVELLYLVTLQK